MPAGWCLRIFSWHASAEPTRYPIRGAAIRGVAASSAQKELTTEYAKDIEGVKEVKNDMTVAATPELAERTAAIAALPVHKKTAEEWRRLNGRRRGRPLRAPWRPWESTI